MDLFTIPRSGTVGDTSLAHPPLESLDSVAVPSSKAMEALYKAPDPLNLMITEFEVEAKYSVAEQVVLFPWGDFLWSFGECLQQAMCCF